MDTQRAEEILGILLDARGATESVRGVINTVQHLVTGQLNIEEIFYDLKAFEHGEESVSGNPKKISRRRFADN